MSNELRKYWTVIGISGVTCGGKTTLAKKLYKHLNPSVLFNQDTYFYPDDSPFHIKCNEIDHKNYDIISSLDMSKMYEDILATFSKKIALNCDKNEAFSLNDRQFMIIEGFTVLNFKPIADLCDLKYYFVLDYDECLRRRSLRVYDPPDVEGYFEKVVWTEHLRYRKEIEGDMSIVFVDGKRNDVFESVMNDIKKIK